MDAFDYDRIPEHMITDIKEYITIKKPVGSFLTAILENDLLEAVAHADYINIEILPIYVNYIYNHIPAKAWGSKEKVKNWLISRYGHNQTTYTEV